MITKLALLGAHLRRSLRVAGSRLGWPVAPSQSLPAPATPRPRRARPPCTLPDGWRLSLVGVSVWSDWVSSAAEDERGVCGAIELELKGTCGCGKKCIAPALPVTPGGTWPGFSLFHTHIAQTDMS